MLKFNKRILVIGYGGVAQCTLPVLFNHLELDYSQVTVIDLVDKSSLIKPLTDKGLNYKNIKISKDNLEKVLSQHVSEGDLIIDLAWYIDAVTILNWCHENKVLYINTSTEEWEPYADREKKMPTELTLYARHMNLRKMTKAWKKTGTTAVIEHGANPGLISHFTKQGLIDIANKLIADKKVSLKKGQELTTLINEKKFNELSMKLGVKVIHVSERDTQITNKPKLVDEFVNTWSVEGFIEEGIAPAELGWGTHEKQLPRFAYRHRSGPKNQICLARMGINTWVSSWVPNEGIRGMLVRHGEAFTLSDFLTVNDKKQAIYRPTVHYAYCPSDSALASIIEFIGGEYKMQRKTRILQDDIITGSDKLGALIMGHPYNSWWIGSELTIDQARKLIPHQNATTMQVAISVVAAIMWMIQNPNQGLCTPEDLPHEYILKIAKPYLGRFISTSSDWTPLKNYVNYFKGHNQPQIDFEDPWQFKNFLIHDSDD
jgi:homospermidine synthase